MGFFDMFKKKHQVPQGPEPTHSLPENKEGNHLDKTQLTGDPSVYTIEFGTRLPIDVIYSFLKEDYETKAYQDAITSPDKSYRDLNLALLRSNLEVKFKQVALRYEDMLREIDFHIESRMQAGLTDIAGMLKSKKATYEKHVEELGKMRKDLDSGEIYMTGIFKSYEVGFTRGLASLSLHNLKNDSAL